MPVPYLRYFPIASQLRQVFFQFLGFLLFGHGRLGLYLFRRNIVDGVDSAIYGHKSCEGDLKENFPRDIFGEILLWYAHTSLYFLFKYILVPAYAFCFPIFPEAIITIHRELMQ